MTWLVVAAREVPREMGDFGILVHSGWDRRSALAYGVLSALTFLLGGHVAHAVAGSGHVSVLLPFATGSFVYIPLADLVPELTTSKAPHDKVILGVGFAAGLLLLLALAVVGWREASSPISPVAHGPGG